MEKYAIWKNHKVIGHIELTEEQKEQLNGTRGIDVYFGFDDKLKLEMYEKTVYTAKNYKVVACFGKPTPLYKVIDTNGHVVKESKNQVEATMWISRQNKH